MVELKSNYRSFCTAHDLSSGTTRDNESTRESVRDHVLSLISSATANAPTSKDLTTKILESVQRLEALCPTPDDEVLSTLKGNWELLWTAQDTSSDEWNLGPLRTWIKYECAV